MNKITKFDINDAFKALDDVEAPAVKGIHASGSAKLDESIKRTPDIDCLLEDYYDIQSKEGIDKAANDRAKDIAQAKLDRIEKIIDIDADSPDQLQPSYVGKDIIQCPQCMQLFYKDPSEVTPSDEDPNTVNVGELCPNCHNDSGFTLIGKVGVAEPEEKETEPQSKNEGKPEETPETEEEPSEADKLMGNKPNEITPNEAKKAENDGEKENEGEGNENETKLPPVEEPEEPTEEPEEKDDTKESLEEANTSVNELLNKMKEPASALSEAVNGEPQAALDRILSDFLKTENLKEADTAFDADAPITDSEADEVFDTVFDEPIDSDKRPATEGLKAEPEEKGYDDFDECSFDSKVNDYLHEVYDNVKNYKTTGVNEETGKFIIKGTIEFESGKQRPTTFEFSLPKCDCDGYYFDGVNKDLTNNGDFRLGCKVKDNALVTEEFSYHYNIGPTLVEGMKYSK